MLVAFALPQPLTAPLNRCAGFVVSAVMPGTLLVCDDWSAYGNLRGHGYDHHAIAECGDPEVAEEFLPISHLVFSNLKTWLQWHPPRRQSARSICKPTSTASSHVPLQQAVLPIQRIPLAAQYRGGCAGADLRRSIFRRLGPPHM